MATERLTLTALEQHEQILAKLHIGPDTPTRQRKESLAAAKPQPPLFNRRESTRRTSSAIFQPTSSQPERKSSKSFLSTASHSSTALSVFRVLQAARTWKRLSRRHQPTPEKPKRRLENTYRLGPNPERAFSQAKVKAIIEDVFSRYLKDFRYSSGGSNDKCLQISAEILRLVKQLDFQRYKFVCDVVIMQNKGQGSEVASRCVWDTEIDCSASLTHAVGDVVCVASVHAVYFE